MRSSSACVCSLVIALIPFQAGAQSKVPSREDLVRGLKAREAAIQNFTVKAEFKVKTKSRYTGEVLFSADVATIYVDSVSGKFWYQRVGQIYNAPGHPSHEGKEFFLDVECVGAFDGERSRHLQRPRDGEGMPAGGDAKAEEHMQNLMSLGTVYPGKREDWIVPPEEFAYTFTQVNLSLPVEKSPLYEILEFQETESVVVVELRSPKAPGQLADACDWKTLFWIDLQHGMVVTRREAFMLRTGETKWIPFFRSRLEELFEAQKGIWLPRKYWQEHSQVPANKPPSLVREVSAILSNWEINRGSPESRFKIAFPEGTRVRDETRGSTYLASAVTDHSVQKAARVSEELREAFGRIRPDGSAAAESGFPYWTATLSTLAAGMVALLIVLALKARRRKGVDHEIA